MVKPERLEGGTVYYLDCMMEFGKYKSRKDLRHVIKNDIQYFEWLLANVDWFFVDREAWVYYLERYVELYRVEQRVDGMLEKAFESITGKWRSIGQIFN